MNRERELLAEARRAEGKSVTNPLDPPHSPWRQPPPQEHKLDPEAMETLRAIQRELSRLANGLAELNDMARAAMDGEAE